MNISKDQYFGDGIYAEFHSYGITLKANDHRDPTDVIFLENEMIDSIARTYNKWKEENNLLTL